MAKQTINIGANANDGSGDAARTAFTKINQNFDDMYGALGNATTPAGAAVSLGTLGMGQSWKDVSSQRSKNTVYYNTTGRPICVSIIYNYKAGAFTGIHTGANDALQQYAGSIDIGQLPIFAVIPAGSPYAFNNSDFILWRELS